MLYFIGILILIGFVAYRMTPPEKLFELGISAERRISGLTLKTSNIEEGEIAYLEGGSGTPLLLLHGFGADKDNWVRMAKHLTGKYRVIAPDLPGFGESFKQPDLNYDVPAQVARLKAFAESIGLSKFHIGGNSMGGYIAGNYAVEHPDQVFSLWLLNPLGVATSPDSEMFAMLRQQERPAVLVGDAEQYRELLAFAFHKPPFIPGVMIKELAKRAEASFPLNSQIFQQIHHISDGQVHFTVPLDTVLKDFDKPTLITWGDKDRVLHVAGADILGKLVPQSKVQVMKDMGHLPMIEAPSQTAKQFLQFHQA
ncbi:alpha/beta fold hydrolase [Grimontia sp. S25]|uniref:Alpha/beta fold hydrolase n=1 Tax=Grimontia sedimenti TaxID=2711294 RepID=A0A6M1RS52_9GAMM|nr:alpha/beta fold hydrolase [Grimontia sedimenti]NGN98847.1 alpha/beta fold hydrolase [Grimontia sedimenti]